MSNKKINQETGMAHLILISISFLGLGYVYTSPTAPSPKRERNEVSGWDEGGECNYLILCSSPQPSPAGEGVSFL